MDASLALAVEQENPSPIEDVAVRLADEGMPVRAIARATHLRSDQVYEALRDAITRGVIVEMPRDDWPAGSIRALRNPFSDTPFEQEDALKIACARFFKATPLEAAMLVVLLKRNEVTKDQLHTVIEQNRRGEGREATDPKMVDVLICKLRKKLRVHEIEITTMWGMGYLITPEHRDLVVRMLCGVPNNS
jgi:hypothetical protein